MTEAAAAARARAVGSRPGRQRGRAPGLTRRTILAAATREFAARGYAGAGVDRIAHQAGVNKAMIYYHFASKAGLYAAILRDLFEPAGEQARAILAAQWPPETKLEALVAMIARRVFAHPELPPIMMREIAEGARHLDPQMLRAMGGLYQVVAAVVAEGRQSGRFTDVDPLLLYFSLIGPLIMFVGGAPVRRAMTRLKVAGNWNCDPETLLAHLQEMLRRLLLGHQAHPSPPDSTKPATSRPARRTLQRTPRSRTAGSGRKA